MAKVKVYNDVPRGAIKKGYYSSERLMPRSGLNSSGGLYYDTILCERHS
jgi:hypothetical protein